jgi:class 3 adenylate cyclase
MDDKAIVGRLLAIPMIESQAADRTCWRVIRVPRGSLVIRKPGHGRGFIRACAPSRGACWSAVQVLQDTEPPECTRAAAGHNLHRRNNLETGWQHQLRALLVADAAGYSQRVAADVRAAICALDAARQVFRRRIEQHSGRVVDTAGDSVLAVFETISGALEAALTIQRELQTVHPEGREARPMWFRIGTHLGDVIEKPDGSVYGNSVNVAARLQAMAAPGDILASDAVRSAVRDSATCSFDDWGRHCMRNFAEPIQVYRVCTPAMRPAARPAMVTVS